MIGAELCQQLPTDTNKHATHKMNSNLFFPTSCRMHVGTKWPTKIDLNLCNATLTRITVTGEHQ